ncbi:MAG TPA: hypothetical protein VFF30_12520 [Nitrososphaerales archaeon]|nr:hypothetical protein [Nitrososphaerales archaeon]
MVTTQPRTQSSRQLIELMAIFAIAWLLVLLGAIIIFKVIVPFQDCVCFTDNILKGVFASILGVVWLLALIFMRNVIVRRQIYNRKLEEEAAR